MSAHIGGPMQANVCLLHRHSLAFFTSVHNVTKPNQQYAGLPLCEREAFTTPEKEEAQRNVPSRALSFDCENSLASSSTMGTEPFVVRTSASNVTRHEVKDPGTSYTYLWLHATRHERRRPSEPEVLSQHGTLICVSARHRLMELAFEFCCCHPSIRGSCDVQQRLLPPGVVVIRASTWNTGRNRERGE